MIRITFRRNARRIIVRRKADGQICATVPTGITMSEAEPVIRRLAEKLTQSSPGTWQQHFHDRQIINCDGLTLRIGTQHRRPDTVIATRTADGALIEAGSSLEWGSRRLDMAVNRSLLAISKHFAPSLLIPLARRIAAEKGIEPKAWKIGHGHRTLGTCSRDGIITLSHILVFLPDQLRAYIICHELAHLCEMNHSPRFHAIVDRLTCGREKELQKMLRTFQWPIIR